MIVISTRLRGSAAVPGVAGSGVGCISAFVVCPAYLEGFAPAQPYVGFLEDGGDFNTAARERSGPRVVGPHQLEEVFINRRVRVSRTGDHDR